MINLFAAFVDLFPHLSCFLGDFSNRDSGILRLDAFSARVQPQHVGTHWPLRGSGVLHLFLLERKKGLGLDVLKTMYFEDHKADG